LNNEETATESEINFSDKYQPLFELLHSWEFIQTDEFKELPTDQQEYWLQLSRVTRICVSGGRDSGKTFGVGVFSATASADYGHSILYTRYTMSSTDKSITKALENRIEEMGLNPYFKQANNTFDVVGSRGEISITGQKTSSGNQTAKLKSIEDYSIFITDEAEELPSFMEWDKTCRSLRRKDVQCLSILVFNGPNIDHWIIEEKFKSNGVDLGFNGIVGQTLYIHTTYIDNGQENMAEHNWNDYEAKRLDWELYNNTKTNERENLPESVVKNAKYYNHVCLGMCRMELGDVIYPDWEIGEFNNDLPYKCFGLDFGSSDPDALVKIALDHKNLRIYLNEEFYKNNTSADGLHDILVDRCGYRSLIVADNNERRMIQDLENKGLNIRKARKTGNASPVRRIRTIQNYKLIVTKNSLNLQESLRKYVWHDKRSGVPKHEFSHLPNAFEYAVMDLLDYTGNA
jgi:phage terminase large subunit